MLLQHLKKALRAAEVKQKEGIPFSRGRAYFFLLECSKQKDLECCRLLRALMINGRLDIIPVLADHLIRLFASCRSLDEANQVFEKVSTPSVHTWCAIIAAHAKLGRCDCCFELYDRMLLSGVKSNKCVYLAMLKTCSNAKVLNQGRQIHHQIVKSELQSDVTLTNSVIDMYAKCGRIDDAVKVFRDLPCRNVVSWNALFAGCINQGDFTLVVQFFELMQGEGIKPNVVSWGALIEGYAEHGEGLLALDSFDKMQRDGLEPDRVIFLSILKACSSIGAICQGRCIHDQIVRMNVVDLDGVGNALIDMYGNCGSLGESRRVLDRLTNRDVVSWNTIITAYALYGHSEVALQCLRNMQLDSIKPDNVTFINILSTCSHAGLVDELYRHIKSMHEDHGIVPDTKHFTCMMDLLGQMGHLSEATNLHQMIEPDIVSSVSLLTACQRHGNVELGRLCFDQAVNSEPEVDTALA
eukprot:c21867_g1_i1 orf=781-2184(-)